MLYSFCKSKNFIFNIIHLLRTGGPYILQKFTYILYVMNRNFYTKIGNNIKKRRNELKMTQQELADAVGVGLNHIGKIEIGYSKPSLDLLLDISTTLNLTISQLSDFTKE